MSDDQRALFIEKAIKRHDGKYDYSLVEYTGSRTHVTIICPEHGQVQQRPDIHLRSMGCPKCARDYRTRTMKRRQSNPEKFFEKSKAVHGDQYDYSKSIYTKGSEPITIGCKTHGDFVVGRAEKHYMKAQGCPHCIAGTSHAERVICDALESQNVVYYREFKFNDLRSPFTDKQLRYDFYIPDHNLLIEYHGVQHFKENTLMHTADRFVQMQEHDRVKKQYALDRNIGLVVFTVSDLKQLRELVIKLV